jgi:hypothetical protein
VLPAYESHISQPDRSVRFGGRTKPYQDNPMAIMDEASSHTVTLARHEIQKVM